MTDDQIKQNAVEKLARLGYTVLPTDTFETISKVVEAATGKKRPYNLGRADHAKAFAAPEKAAPATYRPFRPWKPKAHPRQDEIDAGQPPMDAMTGYGTGYTRSSGGIQSRD